MKAAPICTNSELTTLLNQTIPCAEAAACFWKERARSIRTANVTALSSEGTQSLSVSTSGSPGQHEGSARTGTNEDISDKFPTFMSQGRSS
jgi:hypothetical protein